MEAGRQPNSPHKSKQYDTAGNYGMSCRREYGYTIEYQTTQTCTTCGVGQRTLNQSVPLTTSGSASRDVTAVEVMDITASSADEFGTSGGVKYFATARKDNSYVVLNVTTNPAVPADKLTSVISWSGGEAGSSILLRKVSKETLYTSGISISATCGTSKEEAKVYVFPGKPVDPEAAGTITDKQRADGNVPRWGEAFILEAFDYNPPVAIPYYENKQFKMYIVKLGYEIEWGVSGGDARDISAATAAESPFPLGDGMTAAAYPDDAFNRAIAKNEFRALSGHNYYFDRYWSRAIVVAHECFHITDWRGRHQPIVDALKTKFNSYSIVITTSKPYPLSDVSNEIGKYVDKYEEETTIAWNNYVRNGRHEDRAYAHTEEMRIEIYDSL